MSDDNRACTFEDCGRPVYAKGLCTGHRAQAVRGDKLRPIKRYNLGPKPPCTFDGCERPQYAFTICEGHNRQRVAGKPLTPLRTYRKKSSPCAVCGDDTPAVIYKSGDPLCRKHYAQWKRGETPRKLTRNDVKLLGLAAIADAVANRDRSECWLDWQTWSCWDGLDGHGGTVTAGYPTIGSTRVMWFVMEADGRPRPPAPANHGLHSCDNKLCLNPDHLRWGTHRENMQDIIDSRNYCQHCAHCNPQP